MPTNVSYLTYADAPNPEDFPETWVAESIQDANPEPSAPWVTVTWAEFQDLMADQQAEYAAMKAEEVEQKRRLTLVHDAWQAAWDTVLEWYDVGGMLRFVKWSIDSTSNQAGKDAIDAVIAWIDAVMGLYLMVYKPTILAGGTVELDYSGVVGDAPYTFTEVMVLVNTPWFTTQPSDQIKATGQTATFTIVSAGHPARTHQWQKSTDGGTTWSDINGATSTSYQTPTLSASDDYKVRCKCTLNAACFAYSAAANLTTLP
jgi:hypothetical protein